MSGPGNAVFSPDANQPDATVTVDQYGTYTFSWTEVQSACESTDQVSVVFRSLPALDAGRDTLICFGESVQLDAQGTGTFSWDNIFLLSNTSIRNPVATPIELTDFIVTLTDQYGCQSTDTVVVDVWYDPVAYAGEDTTLHYIFTLKMSGNEIELNETGAWSVLPGEGSGIFDDPEDPETNVTGLSEGDNILLWTVDNGVCPPSYDFIIVTVEGLVVPTLITPNMDGRNDYFVLRGLETLGRTELVIFDRRGAQVYKNENYDNKWNGVDYNENPLPDDTYFYTIRSQNGRSMSGYVVIRR